MPQTQQLDEMEAVNQRRQFIVRGPRHRGNLTQALHRIAGRDPLAKAKTRAASMNRRAPYFLRSIVPAAPEYQHFSSSMAREMIRYHQPLEHYLPAVILPLIRNE